MMRAPARRPAATTPSGLPPRRPLIDSLIRAAMSPASPTSAAVAVDSSATTSSSEEGGIFVNVSLPMRASVRPLAERASAQRLLNYLEAEEHYAIGGDYFQDKQRHLQPYMRRMVVDWIIDVCAVEKCEMSVVLLAVSLLDRFLCHVEIFDNQLQTLGAACLFLSSKVKQTEPLCATRLRAYSDNSISVGEILTWEFFILGKLDWDVAAVTASDFAEFLLTSLSLPECLHAEISKACDTALGQIVREYKPALLPATVQAAAAMVLSVGFGAENSSIRLQLLHLIRQYLMIDDALLSPIVEVIDSLPPREATENVENMDETLPISTGTPIARKPLAEENGAFLHSTTPTNLQDVLPF